MFVWWFWLYLVVGHSVVGSSETWQSLCRNSIDGRLTELEIHLSLRDKISIISILLWGRGNRSTLANIQYYGLLRCLRINFYQPQNHQCRLAWILEFWRVNIFSTIMLMAVGARCAHYRILSQKSYAPCCYKKLPKFLYKRLYTRHFGTSIKSTGAEVPWTGTVQLQTLIFAPSVQNT